MGFAISAKTANTAAAGVMTLLMLLCVGIYARSHIVNKGMTWIFALFSTLIILLAMAVQIDHFLKLQGWFSQYNEATLKLGASGFSLVIISLIFSLLSVLAFYKGDQAVSEGENMNTIMKPVPQQSQSYSNSQSSQFPQSYSNTQSDTNNQPY
nr:10479_t:CDS:2 [Entrophospora candida]